MPRMPFVRFPGINDFRNPIVNRPRYGVCLQMMSIIHEANLSVRPSQQTAMTPLRKHEHVKSVPGKVV